MERFGVSKLYKFRKVLDCSYPVTALLSILAYWLFLVLPSRGSIVVFQLKWWAPLLIIGLIVWLVIELRRSIIDLRLSIGLSDNSIIIGDVTKSWSEIQKAEIKKSFFKSKDAAIILHTTSGEFITIPAFINSLEYIKGFVESHVKDVVKES